MATRWYPPLRYSSSPSRSSWSSEDEEEEEEEAEANASEEHAEEEEEEEEEDALREESERRFKSGEPSSSPIGKPEEEEARLDGCCCSRRSRCASSFFSSSFPFVSLLEWCVDGGSGFAETIMCRRLCALVGCSACERREKVKKWRQRDASEILRARALSALTCSKFQMLRYNSTPNEREGTDET